MFLNDPKAANKLIQGGMYYDLGKLQPLKNKREPLRCLKCQRWGHMAKNCTEEKDTCGTCGGEHCHTSCNSYRTLYCVNCRSPSHSSTDKECPEYKSQLKALNARTPENSMPYFPTEEPWMQVALPPKPSGPITPSQPHPAEACQPDDTSVQQWTLDWMVERQAKKPSKHLDAPVVNGRTLVPLGHSKQN